jgi:DNA-binding GntR family transcriptional regulator
MIFERLTMTVLPHVKPISIRQTVGETIRRALLEGRFRPGQALSEVALASEMNVSRGPVREALLVLAQEGLVSHSQNYGFSVLDFSEHDRLEVQQVRLPLETLALELGKGNLTGTDLAELQAKSNRIVKAYQELNYLECTQADLDFHSLVWDRTGNKRLYAALRNIAVPYFAYGSAFRMSRPDLTAELLRSQHESFISYLSGASEATADQCVRYHLGL